MSRRGRDIQRPRYGAGVSVPMHEPLALSPAAASPDRRTAASACAGRAAVRERRARENRGAPAARECPDFGVSPRSGSKTEHPWRSAARRQRAARHRQRGPSHRSSPSRTSRAPSPSAASAALPCTNAPPAPTSCALRAAGRRTVHAVHFTPRRADPPPSPGRPTPRLCWPCRWSRAFTDDTHGSDRASRRPLPEPEDSRAPARRRPTSERPGHRLASVSGYGRPG